MLVAARLRLPLLLVLAAFAALLTGVPPIAAMGTFSATGDLATARSGHQAVLLDDGRVFVAGGTPGGAAQLASTELYDPTTGAFSPGPDMSVGRVEHRLVLLPDGRVLIVGGFSGGTATDSVDLFDPATDTITAAAPLLLKRSGASATLLVDGTVVVAGGFNGSTTIGSAELYTPGADSWATTGSLAEPRESRAVLLDGGSVLVIAGQGAFPTVRDSAELYSPATGLFSLAGPLATGRFFHTITKLDGGAVLVAGGSDDFTTGAPIASIELYDRATDAFTTVASLATPRALHTASLLADGSVLFFGGDAAGGGSAELYDLSLTGAEDVPIGDAPVVAARNSHTATVLADGKTVLIVGGVDGGGAAHSSAELFTLAGAPVDTPTDTPTDTPADEVALTFADFADIPIPDLTALVTFVPSGFSLLSVSGLGIIFESFSTEATTLETAQAGATRGEILAGINDISDIPSIPTDWFVANGFVLPDRIASVYNPNNGLAWNRDLPPALNTLKRIQPGSAYWVVSDGSNALIDYVVNLPQTITPVAGERFTAFGYFGAPLTIDGDDGGLHSFFDLPEGNVFYQWVGGDSGWNVFTVGAPGFTQTLQTVPYPSSLIGVLTGDRPKVLPPPKTTFDVCDNIFASSDGVDTVVSRLPLEIPEGATVAIEIVALDLSSASPITVTFGDGRDPQEFDVEVCLSSPLATGSLAAQAAQ